MSLTDRGHLSIGEVLSLIQSEFPDVTISKIRFLESQGLIDPERTPSGYRKFYDNDIDRLRWILAQQRDHFLPLKVIKDRIRVAVALDQPLDPPVTRQAPGTSLPGETNAPDDVIYLPLRDTATSHSATGSAYRPPVGAVTVTVTATAGESAGQTGSGANEGTAARIARHDRVVETNRQPQGRGSWALTPVEDGAPSGTADRARTEAATLATPVSAAAAVPAEGDGSSGDDVAVRSTEGSGGVPGPAPTAADHSGRTVSPTSPLGTPAPSGPSADPAATVGAGTVDPPAGARAPAGVTERAPSQLPTGTVSGSSKPEPAVDDPAMADTAAPDAPGPESPVPPLQTGAIGTGAIGTAAFATGVIGTADSGAVAFDAELTPAADAGGAGAGPSQSDPTTTATSEASKSGPTGAQGVGDNVTEGDADQLVDPPETGLGAPDPALVDPLMGRAERLVPASGRVARAADVSAVSFTVTELAAAVGTTTAAIEELERYGLIRSRMLSQGRHYAEDSVIIARLAVRFAAFGIEARHLRMFRVAVDRELALYDQVVGPQARARGERGEPRETEMWAELDQLGANLRDALFHRRDG